MTVEKYKELNYYTALLSSVKDGSVLLGDSVLVVCGGEYDATVLTDIGFKNVTISNLDDRMVGHEFQPFAYKYIDAEKITCEDKSYDWVVVHAGLHHCYSPHTALTEMLRVAKKGIFVFEARDSFAMRASQLLGVTPTYEVVAVVRHGLKHGGVSNTDIPNYIYRWNEREVDKVVNCYLPTLKNNRIKYFYNFRSPTMRTDLIKSPVKRVLVKSLFFISKLGLKIFKKQSNEFGFRVEVGDQLHPWLVVNENRVSINRDYAARHYDISSSGSSTLPYK